MVVDISYIIHLRVILICDTRLFGIFGCEFPRRYATVTAFVAVYHDIVADYPICHLLRFACRDIGYPGCSVVGSSVTRVTGADVRHACPVGELIELCHAHASHIECLQHAFGFAREIVFRACRRYFHSDTAVPRSCHEHAERIEPFSACGNIAYRKSFRRCRAAAAAEYEHILRKIVVINDIFRSYRLCKLIVFESYAVCRVGEHSFALPYLCFIGLIFGIVIE